MANAMSRLSFFESEDVIWILSFVLGLRENSSRCVPRSLQLPKSSKTLCGQLGMVTAKWGVEEVSNWLAEVGFPQLVDGFREQGVDGEVLLGLTPPS